MSLNRYYWLFYRWSQQNRNQPRCYVNWPRLRTNRYSCSPTCRTWEWASRAGRPNKYPRVFRERTVRRQTSTRAISLTKLLWARPTRSQRCSVTSALPMRRASMQINSRWFAGTKLLNPSKLENSSNPQKTTTLARIFSKLICYCLNANQSPSILPIVTYSVRCTLTSKNISLISLIRLKRPTTAVSASKQFRSTITSLSSSMEKAMQLCKCWLTALSAR